MKIMTGQFNDSYFPIMDGVGMTTHNYAHWLNLKYGKSVVVAPKVKDYEDTAGYKVFRFKSVLLPGMNPYRVGLLLVDVKFRNKLKKMKFDLLHAHCPFISGQFARKLATKLEIPLVATFHTKYREDFKKVIDNEMFIEFLMKITLDFYHSADLVWVPNKSTGETLRSYGFNGQYEIIPNGSDMQVPSKPKLHGYRQKGLRKTGAKTGELILLFVGQLRWEKNVRMIIQSLKILKEKGILFRMVFVGEGYASREMKKLAGSLGLEEQVIFTGVVTDRLELQHYYAAADLFVFPSVYDNSPLVIQEAAAFDVPSVVVREISASEPIVDDVNGFVIEADAESLARKIELLSEYPISIKWAGHGARKSLHHPWERIVDDVYSRYVSLIRERQPKIWRQWDDDEEPENVEMK